VAQTPLAALQCVALILFDYAGHYAVMFCFSLAFIEGKNASMVAMLSLIVQ
jgi:hypothetical protein